MKQSMYKAYVTVEPDFRLQDFRHHFQRLFHKQPIPPNVIWFLCLFWLFMQLESK